jgi:hypothetical protein
MIYFTNVSDIVPGKIAEYDEIVTKEMLPLMKKHGINLIAAWSGHSGNMNTIYAVYAYKDMTEAEKVQSAMYGDPAYIKTNVKLNALRTRQVRTYFDPRPWSPMK